LGGRQVETENGKLGVGKWLGTGGVTESIDAAALEWMQLGSAALTKGRRNA
jgi:hypothetical protein